MGDAVSINLPNAAVHHVEILHNGSEVKILNSVRELQRNKIRKASGSQGAGLKLSVSNLRKCSLPVNANNCFVRNTSTKMKK